MPGMDGLQLLEQIHRNWPNCSVIFLTGYNDFDLVYQAIKYPGTKYILKSEPHEKVLAAVRDTLEEIRSQAADKDLMRRVQQEMHTAREAFQKEYCLRLLHGVHFRIHINECIIPYTYFVQSTTIQYFRISFSNNTGGANQIGSISD